MSGWKHRYPFDTFLEDDLYSEMFAWLNTTLGQRDMSVSSGKWRWTAISDERHQKWICFRETKDFILFKMSWHGRLG
jgi:hypothetical protein